ncbi:MAG: tRNA (adenosine(37)-N6)-threonylcarbamoyltransferase complex transferase subunit TsaD [candidate division WWE3 bacterium]|nr:tRNA (adenosine(37)-N6)-threonylcarbamoyltransferase complex transferase subunit TsaD [candidate division WWE3 bacterium]
MTILAVETSCDETAAAIVENGTKLLANVVASSQELHVTTGGIVPEVAAREQVKVIIPVIDFTLKQAGCESCDIDGIAVTVGPGLIGSLLIGVETAKSLSFAWNKPLIAVNHLVGHIYANFINHPELADGSIFPSVVLVVSGGHSDLVLLKNHGEMQWLGGTLDDAAGEAFDKAARILGLGYPGGPAISEAASTYLRRASFEALAKEDHLVLPRPLLHANNYDFSFSGLKTALLTANQTKKYENTALAFEFQEAVVDCLVKKTIKAASHFNAKSIMLAGGVAANMRLREIIGKSAGNIPLYYPEPKFCTDNAAMIGSAAFFNQTFVPWENLVPDSSLSLES